MAYTLKVFTSVTKRSKNQTFEFTVDTPEQAEAHAKQIVQEGYRRKVTNTTYDWISPYTIIAVRVIGPAATLGYSDSDVSV